MQSDNVWILILAAGRSERMGRPKQLLPLAGESMVRYVAGKALQAQANPVAVVCGKTHAEVHQQLLDLPVALIQNPHPEAGLSSSLQAGVRFVTERRGQAAVILLGDQPGVRPDVIRRVIGTYRERGCKIAQARYADGSGHPVLFDRNLFPELLKLQGDIGAKEVLARHRADICRVDVPEPMPRDIDTPEQYEQVVKSMFL
jgi:molybdenum cofactor cytidylyltransferase